jgi:hypothetical protein
MATGSNFLRANASAHGRKGIGVPDRGYGAQIISFSYFFDKAGNVYSHGTAVDTERFLALEAASGLKYRRFLVVSQRDFVEIGSAYLGLLFRHGLPGYSFCHDSALLKFSLNGSGG